MPHLARLPTLLLLIACAGASAAASAAEREPYVFGWPFIDTGELQPRGGTTEGAPVELRKETTEAFERLQASGLSKPERDRRAIRAMAGSYRVSFDFLETVGYAPDYEPARPYRSWGTEHIYVVEDSEERIVLQHILAMTVIDEDGELQGPFVTKHWRQEWEWQAETAHIFRGLGQWQRERRSKAQRRGRWLQTVWQVDDSPRYAAWGRWDHTPERSTWRSEETWRPLPRREFSVRDDYDVLIGTNRHTILPTGWVHEQRNTKAVLAAPGEIERRLATEIGVARYQRITDLEREAADEYWQATQDFWEQVRAYWDRAMEDNATIELRKRVDGEKMFQPLFERARQIASGKSFSAADNRRFVRETIDAYRGDGTAQGSGY